MRPKITFCIVLMLAYLSNLHSQEISMFPSPLIGNMYFQDDTQISKVQVESLLSAYEPARTYWYKAKEHTTITWLSAIATFGCYVWAASIDSSGGDINDVRFPAISSIAFAGMSIGFLWSAQNLRRKAILNYNAQATNQSYYQIRSTENGVGIVFTF